MTRPSPVSEVVDELRSALLGRGDPAAVAALQRYFTEPVEAIGVSNADVAALADGYFTAHAHSPAARLDIAEALLERARYHEEVMLGFAVLHRIAQRNFDAALVERSRYWLEHVVSNWAQCDDLCIKLLYRFFLGHPDLITSTQCWVDSASPWARRAANVSVVKFVRRKIGHDVYELPLDVVFDNTLHLIDDREPYVQKGVGWLLKVASQVHPSEVEAFLRVRAADMNRATLRLAVEKYDPSLRRSLLAAGARRT
jgi:3-methyladenine DNA glycosylase AlkD